MQDRGGIVTYVLYEIVRGKLVRCRDFPYKPQAISEGWQRREELGGSYLVQQETFQTWRSRRHLTIDVVWRSEE